MSVIQKNAYSDTCLVKSINNIKVYLYRSFDFAHGYGYYACSISPNFKLGFGFHKSNKFTAVKEALNKKL